MPESGPAPFRRTRLVWTVYLLWAGWSFCMTLIGPAIPYLRPALDIPYCHHEHWDGSGYPRGLVADQIPLAARVFAVVDMWDELRYRKTLPEDQVRDRLQTLAGTNFDPEIVDVFLKLEII